MRPSLALVLLLLATSASAQIYRYTDANGNVQFSDKRPVSGDSEEVSLPPTNTIQPPAAGSPGSTQSSERAPAGSYRIRLSGLPDAEALRANNGTFSVSIQLDPALEDGHTLRLLLDGKPYDPPSPDTQRQLVNLDRGEHRLAAEVLDRNGRSLQRSSTVTFTVQRVNVNASPALRPAPPVKPKAAP